LPVTVVYTVFVVHVLDELATVVDLQQFWHQTGFVLNRKWYGLVFRASRTEIYIYSYRQSTVHYPHITTQNSVTHWSFFSRHSHSLSSYCYLHIPRWWQSHLPSH